MNTKAILISIAMGIAALQAGAAEYWTAGVNSDENPTIGNWKDYNKIFVPAKNNFKEGEEDLCWAASASNMLAWWQQNNADLLQAAQDAYGSIPPEIAENGGKNIWDIFKESFTDDGFYQHAGIHWWLNGGLGPAGEIDMVRAELTVDGQENGNYYNFSSDQVDSYLTCYDTSADVKYLKSRLVREMKKGNCLGGSVYDATGDIAHAITIWGINYDEATDTIHSIWITDSDDEDTDSNEQEPGTATEAEVEEERKPTLRNYAVKEQVITTKQGNNITVLTLEDYHETCTIYLGWFSSLSIREHEPVQESLASMMTTVNGVRSYTLVDSLLSIDDEMPDSPPPGAVAGDNSGTQPKTIVDAKTMLQNRFGHLLESFDVQEMERLSIAVAGSSIPTLGKAFSDDVNRQLRTIRDRANASTHSITPDKNYCVWVEADGNTARLGSESDGTDAGYDMQSWGGTVGITSKFAEEVHAGIAFTALRGNFSAHSYDHAKGDLDTYYFSTYATVNSGCWEHSFVATAAKADTTLSREVLNGNFYSRNRGKSDGMGFGFIYETAYNIKPQGSSLTFSPVLNVSATHSRLHGYTERGDALALAPGVTDMKLLTLGAGARLQGEFGENLFNRKAQFQCRALMNAYLGDRRAETPMKFAAAPARQTIRSAESGTIGLELGAGVALPLGDGSSAIYADAAAEFNSGYNSANFNLGYRFSF